MSKSIYIVYETTNLVNGKFYIGVHRNNGRKYLGSGKILKLAVEKYGSDNFVRETLKTFDNESDAYCFEKLIVDDDMVRNTHCYNITVGGGCPPTGFGDDNNFYGMKHTDETKKKISESRLGSVSWMKGKKHKPESNKKNSDNHRKLSDDDLKECINLCLDGWLINDIAKRFNVVFQTIYRHLQNDENCNKQMKENKEKPRNKLSLNQIEEVTIMRKQGRTYKEIGNIFNITRQTVSKYINLGGK